jgi:protein SCO1/2
MNKKRLLGILVLIFLICAGLLAYLVINGQKTLLSKPDASPRSVATATSVGGPFSMIDHNGQAVTEANYAGRYKLVFFGFTNCPAVCPTELQKMADLLDILVKDKTDQKITPLFVTTDPERDDAATLASYVAKFDDRIIGLTGSREQVDAMMKAYKVYGKKIEMPHMGEGEYMMDHSSFTYLMSAENELLLVFDMQDKAEDIAKEIQAVM